MSTIALPMWKHPGPHFQLQIQRQSPLVFTLVNWSQASISAADNPPSTNNPMKKRKRKEKEESGIKGAKKVDPTFSLQGKEEWSNFCGVCLNSKLMWDEKRRICVHWNVWGLCFENYNNKSSHIIDDENPPGKKDELKAWMEKVRASHWKPRSGVYSARPQWKPSCAPSPIPTPSNQPSPPSTEEEATQKRNPWLVSYETGRLVSSEIISALANKIRQMGGISNKIVVDWGNR